MNINELLREAVLRKASDLHLKIGLPPMMRIWGELFPLHTARNEKEEDIYACPALAEADIKSLAIQIMPQVETKLLASNGEIDFSFRSAEDIRCRVNIYFQENRMAIAMRIIPPSVPTVNALGLPRTVGRMAGQKRGLLLVTGPSGSGKTATLASMINHINSERRCHIITLEDPIEYIHFSKKSIINQREIGTDSLSFASALRSALRQDPDVIQVGEMRDLETISTAITAAETGHLVLATLHTIDAPQTINRIIDIFPPYQQEQVRVQLANTLVGVISQKLLKRSDDSEGRVVATEILKTNNAIRNLIREGKIYQIYSLLQTGIRQGMHLMDSSLQKLHKRGLIDYETAMENAIDPESLGKMLDTASEAEAVSKT